MKVSQQQRGWRTEEQTKHLLMIEQLTILACSVVQYNMTRILLMSDHQWHCFRVKFSILFFQFFLFILGTSDFRKYIF